jgi:hypothetical protein
MPTHYTLALMNAALCATAVWKILAARIPRQQAMEIFEQVIQALETFDSAICQLSSSSSCSQE